MTPLDWGYTSQEKNIALVVLISIVFLIIPNLRSNPVVILLLEVKPKVLSITNFQEKQT